MQKVKKLYREEYTGESIVTALNYANNNWESSTEYLPNAVFNNQISNKAVVLGNGPTRTELTPNLFDLLSNHRGGLLAAGALQTYGCNAIVRDFTPDFVVANDEVAHELVNSGVCNRTIVYGTAAMVLKYPGKFYLVPQQPAWDMGAIAAYLACFDGHRTVYLLGFDCYDGHSAEHYTYNVYVDTPGYPTADSPNTEAFFVQTLKQVMTTYSQVDFVRVMPNADYAMPDSWKYFLNLRQISFNDFVREVDL